jgi:alkaline phosphatase D
MKLCHFCVFILNKIKSGAEMSKISRRDVLRYSLMGASSVVISSSLLGCSGGDDDVAMSFSHGIASGDPLQDRVIIWTRALPDDVEENPSLQVSYELATDEAFNNVVRDGDATVNGGTDFTLKVDVVGLDADTVYFYRFKSGRTTSAVGRTKTLPALDAQVDQIKLAFFSCSNYPAGYFNAYTEASLIDDLDAALHLGDYIYEYRMGEYATENAEAIGRALPADNDVETVTLADYRRRYALYREDAGLLALHAHVPMIVVPDDHEVTNDTYLGGAENHDPDTEGEFSVRKANALQAYFEWLPIRPASADDQETLYRAFQWGGLVNLMMLDTRLIGRDEQLDFGSFFTNNDFDTDAFIAALTDPSRTMLGSEQLQWLQAQLTTSQSVWQVLGQQVLMGRMNIPLEVLLQLQPGVDSSAILAELATLKVRELQGDPTLTESELARISSVAPYNLDAWDGYAVEREIILGTAAAAQKNLIVLAGDTHNAWANNLTTQAGDNVGVEFATPGVTSPGLEGFLELSEQEAQGLESALGVLIDDLQYSNLYDRGLGVVTFTAQRAEVEWIFVDSIDSTNYNLKASRSMTLGVDVGSNILS